jgi:hypothetical protein
LNTDLSDGEIDETERGVEEYVEHNRHGENRGNIGKKVDDAEYVLEADILRVEDDRERNGEQGHHRNIDEEDIHDVPQRGPENLVMEKQIAVVPETHELQGPVCVPIAQAQDDRVTERKKTENSEENEEGRYEKIISPVFRRAREKPRFLDVKPLHIFLPLSMSRAVPASWGTARFVFYFLNRASAWACSRPASTETALVRIAFIFA